VHRLVAAEWLRMGRHWLSWTLLVLLIVILALQVNSKLNRLAQLKREVETGVARADTPLTPAQIESNRYEIALLQRDLAYPAFIGTAARLATGSGWFLLILFAAVAIGEDFSRRTLRALLARGVGRTQYVLARTLALWLATGVAVAAITLLAALGGLYTHTRATGDPASLAGLGEALLYPLRAWLTCLPFIAIVVFWVVLARQAGPALGVGLSIHFFEHVDSFMLPFFMISQNGVEMPWFFRVQGKILAVTPGYNANVFLYWGPPVSILPQLVDALRAAGATFAIPTDPWRAVAFLVGYTIVPLGLAMWILHRRDITYAS
jgi:ABC-type transport system involved in multi-copper enzyme maturation permease subunit